jgi:hypothetical protein
MAHDIIKAIAKPDFVLDLTYANGEQRRFDMRPLLAMRPWTALANATAFAQVSVDYGTVVWPGEIDVAPETLYAGSTPLKENLGAAT